MSQPYETYEQVPWYRRSSVISIFTLLGLCFSLAILFVCIIVLTGDVYYDQKDAQGELKRWSVGNKIAAVIILILQIAFTAAYLSGVFKA